MRLGNCRSWGRVAAIFLAAASAHAAPTDGFDFKRDTLSFANSTVFEYHNGEIVSRWSRKSDRYTRRCFVMTRTVEQFYKFARFDMHSPPLDDRELSKRIRALTRQEPWRNPWPIGKRIIIPAYRNLRELSQAKTRLMQRNIGLGWVAYLRPGNARMFYLHDRRYQEKTHRLLEEALASREFFIAYLSDFPI